jgi:hypothetical protein
MEGKSYCEKIKKEKQQLLVVNKTNNIDIFEENMAWIRAILIQEYINKLSVKKNIKLRIKKEVIKILEST